MKLWNKTGSGHKELITLIQIALIIIALYLILKGIKVI